jgi:hypothetical protein
MKIVVKKRSAYVLGEGVHVGTINEAKIINSFEKNLRGELKDELPGYANPTRQIALVLVSGDGVITTRLNVDGFVKYADLSQKQIDSGKYQDINGYAVMTAKNVKNLDAEVVAEFNIQPDDVVRIPSSDNTESCANMISDVCAALGANDGDDALEVIEDAVVNKTAVKFTVSTELYKGAEVKKVGKFKAAPVAEDVPEEVEEEDNF